MRVAVVGAGVVGVTTAYMLARRGFEVTLVESGDHAAGGSSYANGGQLSYSYVAPLAGPGVLASLPVLLTSRESPVRLRPRLDPHQWRWCALFALACRASVARLSTGQLLSLSRLSRDVLHELVQHARLEFGHRRNGKLVVYRSAAQLEKARALVDGQAAHGMGQQVLDEAATLALEPSLAALQGRLAGAVYTPSDEAGDCRRFTQALLERLAALDNVALSLGNRVHALRRRGRTIVALATAQGDIATDAVVVAAGLGSRALVQPLGQDLPIYPLKGYSLSVPVGDAGDRSIPTASVTDYERRVVYARLDGELRIAAMVDIDGGQPGVDSSRIELLKRQVGELFPRLDLGRALAWAGMRPATPTGKPIVGRSPYADNLWLNTGHGALGFTLACGSAALLVEQMEGTRPSLDPEPFRP